MGGRFGVATAVATLLLSACGGRTFGTPGRSSGPAFIEQGRISEERCGKDMCISQAFMNAGNEPGSGECQLIKFEFLQSHKDTRGPKFVLPIVQPGETTTVTARWPRNEVANRNVFGFACKPGPLM